VRYLNNYKQFINEGAHVNKEGTVILNYKNDPNNNDEVLKTDLYGKEFLDREKSEWPVYWSLSVTGFRGKVDHEGRFKYTMDQLKGGNIEGGRDSLSGFMMQSFDRLGIMDKPIRYVVAVGSTYGLVQDMAEILASKFNARIINLEKAQYLNAGDAVDWLEYQSQVLRQSKEGMVAASFEGFKKMLISTYVDVRGTDPVVIKELRGTQDVESLKDKVTTLDIKWKDKDIDGKSLLPFIVRSSGRNFGGYRKMWKPKYQFDNSELYDAIVDCATNRSKMIIIDDNQNSGEDFKTIKNQIEKMILTYQKDSTLQSDNKVISKYSSNFLFYVLYQMQHRESRGDFYYLTKSGKTANRFSADAEIVNDFKNFIRGQELAPKYAEKTLKKEETEAVNVSRIGVDLFNLFNAYAKIESAKTGVNDLKTRKMAYAKSVNKKSEETGIPAKKIDGYYKKYLKQVNLHRDPAYNLTLG